MRATIKHKEQLLKTVFKGESAMISAASRGWTRCFPRQLKDTMNPKTRTLLRMTIEDAKRAATAKSVERLMGNKPEARFQFMSEYAEFRGGARYLRRPLVMAGLFPAIHVFKRALRRDRANSDFSRE